MVKTLGEASIRSLFELQFEFGALAVEIQVLTFKKLSATTVGILSESSFRISLTWAYNKTQNYQKC